MSKWKDSYGDIYETEEDARENALNAMTWDDICTYFKNIMSFEDFFELVRARTPNFSEVYENQILDAEDNYFNNNYTEAEDA